MKKSRMALIHSISRSAAVFFDLLFTAISLTFCAYLSVITSHASYMARYLSLFLPAGSTAPSAVLTACLAVCGAAVLFYPEGNNFKNVIVIIYSLLCIGGVIYYVLSLKQITLLRLLFVPAVLYIAAAVINAVFLGTQAKDAQNIS